MKKEYRLAGLIALGCLLLFACAGPAAVTATLMPSLTPPVSADALNLVDLVEQGTVTFAISSGAINQLGLSILNSSDKPVDVSIPVGTFFVNNDPLFQNMVVLHPAGVSLQPLGSADVLLDVACANLHLTEPTQDSIFALQRDPQPPELTGLLNVLAGSGDDFPVEQAAVWIITDDASFDELGMLVEGSRFGKPIIDENAAARAMLLVDQAGLDIRTKAIWEDRYQMMGLVTDAQASAWLSDMVATQSVLDATRAVLQGTEMALTETQYAMEATQTAQAVPTFGGEAVSQYAILASASSEYTSSGFSAMQAAGAPDTTTCGDNSTAWASATSRGVDWLLLDYESAVIPTQIVIYETYHPNAVLTVEVFDADGNAISVYEGAPASVPTCPYELVINVTGVYVPVRSVKVTIDQSAHTGWNEIDAVMLTGFIQ